MPTVDYRQLYTELMEDVRGLRDDLRAMHLQASDREVPAYQDAHHMAHGIIREAEDRERNQTNG